MMNEMMKLMETGMELIENGASWLFYEATTAQVILLLASAKVLSELAAQLRALADNAIKDFKELLKVH